MDSDRAGTVAVGDLLTTPQAAALMQCKPSTIRAWFTRAGSAHQNWEG